MDSERKNTRQEPGEIARNNALAGGPNQSDGVIMHDNSYSVNRARKYSLLLPVDSPEKIRRNIPTGLSADKADWVVSEICKRSAVPQLLHDGYAVAGYSHLEQVVQRKEIPAYLRFLTAQGVIERDSKYLPAKFDRSGKGKSYGYRLGEGFRDLPLVRLPGGSRSVMASLAAFDRRERVTESRLPYPYSALNAMAKRIALAPECGDVDQLERMEAGNRYGKRCEFGGRFHESFQCIPKVLRRFVGFAGDGEPLFQADISSSQPLILISLVKSEFGHVRGVLAESAELERVCLAGDLYKLIQAELQGLTQLGEFTAREFVSVEDAKVAFMQFAMGNAAIQRESKGGRVVRRLWPCFWQAACDLARLGGSKSVARALQRRESELVLEVAAARILRECPEIEFGTVHDAIVCRGRHIAYVARVVEESYSAALGAVPTVKTGSWAIIEPSSAG